MSIYLNDGSSSVASENWSNGVGFTADAQLEINNQTQHIKDDLDQSAAGAIDYIHVIGGAPRIIGSDGSSLKVTIDNSYTAKPNVLWTAQGGEWSLDLETNSAPLVVAAGGGKFTLADGSADVVVVVSGEVVISSTFTIVTGVYVAGGSVTIYDKSNEAIPDLVVNAGRCHCYRRVTNGTTNYTGRLAVDFTTAGLTHGNLNLNGGEFSPIAGSWNYVYRNGGTINTGAITRSLSMPAIGGTNDGPGKYPSTGGLLTVTNMNDRVVYATASFGGVGVPLP